MTDYNDLVKDLRNCANYRCSPADCGWFDKYQVDESCKGIIMWKAADAIEALQAENTDIREELFVSQRKYDNFVAVASMKNAMLAKQIPKLGEWIKLDMHKGMEQYKCSACDQVCYVPECMGDPMYIYCPNCGAKMEVQE